MRVFWSLPIFLFVHCTGPAKPVSNTNRSVFEIPVVKNGCSLPKPTEVFQVFEFLDSIHIGRHKKTKIEFYSFYADTGSYDQIRISQKLNSGLWECMQQLQFTSEEILSPAPEICDFNNDGFGDLTYHSFEAARGGNDVRKLFIYDNEKNQLVEIKNAERYPNIRYNEDLDCIDSWMLYGGSSTVFLKISGDSLVEFAEVYSNEGREVIVYDANGNAQTIRKDSVYKEDDYTRYKSFKPLKVLHTIY